MKYIGIDYGTKRVGVAVSDETGSLAFPRRIIKNDSLLIKELVTLAREENAEAAVIGQSLDSEGKDNAIMEKVRAFASAFGEAARLPLHFERESFSSVEARRLQARGEVDDSAAALILQRYLDRQRPESNA